MKRKCWFENITGEKHQLAFMWKQVQHITNLLRAKPISAQKTHQQQVIQRDKESTNGWQNFHLMMKWHTWPSKNVFFCCCCCLSSFASSFFFLSRSAFCVNKRKIKTDNEKAHKQQTANSWSLSVGACNMDQKISTILEAFVSLIGFGAYNNHLGDICVIDMTTTDTNKTDNNKKKSSNMIHFFWLLVGIGFRFLVY